MKGKMCFSTENGDCLDCLVVPGQVNISCEPGTEDPTTPRPRRGRQARLSPAYWQSRRYDG